MGQLQLGSPGEDPHAGKYGESTPLRLRGGSGRFTPASPLPALARAPSVLARHLIHHRDKLEGVWRARAGRAPTLIVGVGESGELLQDLGRGRSWLAVRYYLHIPTD